jgi:hypothetical protein
MKSENTPGSYGLLAGLLVFAFGLLCVDIGCAYPQSIPTPNVIDTEYDASLVIEASCVQDGQLSIWHGSGAAINGDTLLTAGHVAEVPKGAWCAFVATDRWGKRHLVAPSNVWPSDEIDMATMMLVSPVDAFDLESLPSFGPPPELGEHVCTVTAYPRSERKCGDVMFYKELPGNLRMSIVVEPGNSGSPLYDDQGRIVGVVVHLFFCGNGQYCTGAATTVWGRM